MWHVFNPYTDHGVILSTRFRIVARFFSWLWSYEYGDDYDAKVGQ